MSSNEENQPFGSKSASFGRVMKMSADGYSYQVMIEFSFISISLELLLCNYFWMYSFNGF